MKVIVGLGNPGKEYEQTRHNAGFMVVERLAKAWGINGKQDSRFECLLGEGRVGSERVFLVEPLTFMNLSGRSVQKVLAFYKLTADDMLVIYDDFALPLGTLRVRISGSAGGHNGISSIIQCLGTQSFPRLRLGVGPLPAGASTTNFVLGKFAAAERPTLEQALAAAEEAVEMALQQGYTAAMQRFNKTLDEKTPT